MVLEVGEKHGLELEIKGEKKTSVVFRWRQGREHDGSKE